MNKFLSIAVGIGEFLQLLWETLKSIKYFSSSSDKFLFQVFDMGNRTLPVAALISLSIGSVLALLTGIQLSGYGIEDKIGGIVGISLCTELAPVMAAILMAGRVGSSITAELSSMNIYEEISALKTMKIDPVRYLVLPRFLACLVTLPFSYIYGFDWMAWRFFYLFDESINISFIFIFL